MKKNKLTKICFLSVTFLFLFLININVRASVLEKINVKNDLVRVVVSAENENCPAFGDIKFNEIYGNYCFASFSYIRFF